MINRSLILLITVFSTVLFGFATMKSDREELRLVGDVKSVIINENGRPSLRYEFLANVGNLFIGYTYKDDGSIEYLIKPGSSTPATDTTEATKTFLWQKGLKTVYKRVDHYDEAGNVVGYSYYDSLSNQTEFVKQSYKYDVSGNKDERGTGITDAKKNKVEKFAYDNIGNIIEKAEFINGTKAREFKYQYEFDLEGNWTKRTVQAKDIAAGQNRFNQSSITTRDFSYFTLKNPPPPVIDPTQLNNNFGFADSVHVLGADVILPSDSKSTLTWRLTGKVPVIKAGDFLTAGDVAKSAFNFIRAVETVMKNPDGSVIVTTQRVPPASLPRRKPGDPGMPAIDPNAPVQPDPTPIVPSTPLIRLKDNSKAIYPNTYATKIAGLDTKDKLFTKITLSAIDTQPTVGSFLYLALNPPIVNEDKYLKVEALEQKYGVTIVTASNATPFDILRPAKPGRPGLVQYQSKVIFTKVLADYKMTELTENSVAFLDPSPNWQVGDIVVLDQSAPPAPVMPVTPGNPGMIQQPQPQPMPMQPPAMQPGMTGIGSASNERRIVKIYYPVAGMTVFETTQAEPKELYNVIDGYPYPKLQPKITPGLPGIPNGPGPNMNPNDMPLILTPDMPYVFKRITTVNNMQLAIFDAPGPQVAVGRKIIIPATPIKAEVIMTVTGLLTTFGNSIGIPVTVDNQNGGNNPATNPVPQQPVQPPKPTLKAGVKLIPDSVRIAYYNETSKTMILNRDTLNLRKGDLVVYEGKVIESNTKAAIQGIQVRITSLPPIGGVLRYGFEKVSRDEVYDQPQPQAQPVDPGDGGNMGGVSNGNNARPKTVGPGQALPPVIVPYF